MTNSPSRITVPIGALPATCPPAAQWDRHPRVYLPLSPQKPKCACPYCGALYVLEKTNSPAQ